MKIYYEINAKEFRSNDITCEVFFFDKDKDPHSIKCWTEEENDGRWNSSTYKYCQVHFGYNDVITWSDKKCDNILIVIDDDINNTHIFYDYSSFRTFWEELLGIDKKEELKRKFLEIRRKQVKIEKKIKELNKDFQEINEPMTHKEWFG